MRNATPVCRSAGLAVFFVFSVMMMTDGLARGQILDADENFPVLSPITNQWGEANTTKVDTEHFEIFRSGGRYRRRKTPEDQSHTLAYHPHENRYPAELRCFSSAC